MSEQTIAELPPGDQRTDGETVGRHDAFVSYARRPSDQRFVDELACELQARGKRIWVDRADIPPGSDWQARIGKGIEGSSALIFVLSPRSAASAVCAQELSMALEQNKRIIPVLHERVDAAAVPPPLARLNWIPFTEEDDRDEALGKLLDAIDTDLEWRDAHTRLAMRAGEWRGTGGDASLLLRGGDLRAAEAWYAARERHKEAPTPAQLDYILASRRAASRRQRTLLGAVSVALAVAIGLAIFALIERANAVRQTQVALSRLLASEAGGAAASDVRVQTLLALESFSRSPSAQARSAVVGAVEQPLIAVLGAASNDAEINGLAYSPDGRLVAAATKSGVRIWDRRTLGLVRVIGSGQFNSVAFSPDGRELAAGGAEGAFVYHLGSKAAPGHLGGAAVGGVAFAPASGMVAAVTKTGVVALWDPSSGALQTTRIDGFQLLNVAFAPSGGELAVGGSRIGGSGIIVLYRVGSALSVAARFTPSWQPDDLAFAPDSVTLAAARSDGGVELFNAVSGTGLGTLPIANPTYGLAINAAGTLLAAGDSTGAVTLWNLRSRAQLGAAMAEGTAVYAVAFAPDGRSFCGGGIDGAAFLWSATGTTPLATGFHTGAGVDQLALAGRGTRLLTADRDGGASLWDLRRGRLLGRITPQALEAGTAGASGGSYGAPGNGQVPLVTTVAADGSSGHLALGLTTGVVEIEDAHLTARLLLLRGPSSPVYALTYDPHGRYLAAGYEDGSVTVWQLHPLRVVDRLSVAAGGVTSLAFDPSGARLAIGWELPHAPPELVAIPGRRRETFTVLDPIFSLAFTPDGATLIAGDSNGKVELFDAGTLVPTGVLASGGSAIEEVAASPDGQTIAAADATGVLRLFDRTTQQQLGDPLRTAGAILGAAFAASSGQLVTADATGEVVRWPRVLWSRSPGSFSRVLCPRLAENLSHAQWAADVGAGESYHATCPRG